MPLSGWEETLAVRAIQAPAGAVRSRGGGWGGGGGSLLSGGRALQEPGPRGRSGGASSPRPALTACAGRRCASPRGPAQSRAARPAPLLGTPSPPEPGAWRPRPLSLAPAAGCLCCFLSLDRPPAACSPPAGRGVGESSPPGLHAPTAAPVPRGACTGPRRLRRAAARMHRPHLLLLLLRAPGVGGGEAGEQWQPRQLQRAAEARMQPQRPRCREITSRGGAGWMCGRPRGLCTWRAR